MLNRDTSETALFAKTIHPATGTVHSSTFAEPISDYSMYCTQVDQIPRLIEVLLILETRSDSWEWNGLEPRTFWA